MFEKRLKTLVNRLLAKRLVGETSINWYKGGTLTRGLTLLLTVTKDLAFFRLVTNGRAARVLSRIYSFGGKSRVTKGHELPRGVRGHAPPGNFCEMNMRWNAIWCILRHNFGKCYSVCTDLVASGCLFRYSYLYTVMIIFLGGESFYPSNTLPNKIWTSEHLFGVVGCPSVFALKKQNKTKQNKQTKHANWDRETRAVLRISIWRYTLSKKNNRLLVF